MRDRKRRYGGVVGLAVMALALAACDDAPEAAAPEPRPVRVVTVGAQTAGETLALSGLIEAETEADLAFRIGGRMIERLSTSATWWRRGSWWRGSTARMRRTPCAARAPR